MNSRGRCNVVLTATTCLLALPHAALAKLPPVSLEEFAHAPVIVTGTVDEVQEVDGVSFAVLSVEASWTSTASPTQLFVFAERTWGCDISRAVAGERVLMFLSELDLTEDPTWSSRAVKRLSDNQLGAARKLAGKKAPVFQIYWSGHGRMPEKLVDGRRYVGVPLGVDLPKSMTSIPWKERVEPYTFVLLADVRELVRTNRSRAR